MQEVHADEGQHTGRLAQNTDAEVAERHGHGDEGRDQGNDEHEPPAEPAPDPADTAGIRETVRNHGHEGGDDERRHRRCDGRRR